MKHYITLLISLGLIVSAFANDKTWTSDDASGTLPIMYINTADGVQIGDDKDNYISGSLIVGEKSTQFSPDEMMPIEIRRRGNHSWEHYDKKPYKIKLNKARPLLGLKPNKHFALLAGADGLLHDILGFAVSRAIGLAWTPEVVPVELVLNGEYIGLYLLTETIRVGTDRVNIASQKDGETDPELITGGWLCEIDNYFTDYQINTYLDLGRNVGKFTYHSPENLSQQQHDYLYNQLFAISHSLQTGTSEWHDYVDLEALARFYIIQEICENVESFAGSCYFYKDRGADTKWIFGPGWDFGNATISYRRPSTSFFWEGSRFVLVWIKWMVRDPEFMSVVKQQWRQFYASYQNEIEAEIDRFVEVMRSANEIDRARWPKYNRNDIRRLGDFIKDNIKTRMEWLDSAWSADASDILPTGYYNLQGIRVARPARGLYIRNGQKVLIN